jgi:hypothetical protein
MKLSSTLFLGIYKLSLHLYPRAFRHRYAKQLIDAARLQQAESPNDLALAASLLSDTLRSAVREHFRAATPARPAYVAAFALFFTFLLIAVSVVNQQILRRRADLGPTALARIISSPTSNPQSEAVRAHIAAQIATGPKIDLSSPRFINSATMFAVIYDPSGQPVAGNAVLHGILPRLPHGLFHTIRDRREFRVTWQPRVGIRVALTGDTLPSGGFVVAGQSLIASESAEIRFHSILLWMWAFAMVACCFLVLSTRKPTRTPQPDASK